MDNLHFLPNNILTRFLNKLTKYKNDYISIVSILLFKGFSLFVILIFLVQNASTLLCFSRDKTKGQSCKNKTLTPTKTLPKK